jgi:membrane-associated phospholipid phosphatase
MTTKTTLRIKPQARLLGVFIGLIAVFLLLLYCDIPLLQWRLRVMPRDIRGLYKQVIEGFRNFAQMLTVVVAIVVVFRMDERRKRIIVAILLAQTIAAIGYNAGKYAVARYRPFAALEELPPNFSNANTWMGWNPDLGRAEKYRSFPSGHSAAAFALAGVLAWYYPRLKITFWTLAVGCAASRWIDVMHWPSDCFVGAVIGYASAWWTLRLAATDKERVL